MRAGPKPSLFFFLGFVFGGFKGQVRWHEGPPHLALNPPYWFCLFVVLCFCLRRKKSIFPLEKGCLFLNVSLCFFLAFCLTSLFTLSLSVFFFFLFLLLSFFRSLFLSFDYLIFCLLCCLA